MSEKICRLCLHTIGIYNCQTVEESLLKSLKLNLKISKENMMCNECATCLQGFANFTSGCFYASDGTLPLSDPDSGAKWDQKPIDTTSNSKSLMEKKIKCSFCTKTRQREDLISLQTSKENKFLVNMLEQYIMETNFKNTEDILTCDICLEALQRVSSVILKCLEVEEKINEYIELKGTDDKGQVELKEVQKFMSRSKVKLESESFSVNKLEGGCDHIQEKYTTRAEYKVKDENQLSNTELIIKTEDDIRQFSILKSMLESFSVNKLEDRCDQIQEEYTMMAESKIKDEKRLGDTELNIKAEGDDVRQFSILKSMLESFSVNKLEDRCDQIQEEYTMMSESEIKDEKRLGNTEQNIKTEDDIRPDQSDCDITHTELVQSVYDGFQEPPNRNETPNDPLHISVVISETRRYKDNIKQHPLSHKYPSEKNMFKCESCSYETRRKGNMKNHLLTHKSPSEVRMFKCEVCSFETKHKVCLKRHLLTHKSPSEITMFKCKMCSYEARRKSRLKIHLLTHKIPCEIKMFKCELCSYEAKHKSHLTRHLSTHNRPFKTKIFKCELCSYETKYKEACRRHFLIHKSPSEIKMFKCEFCSHEVKHKDNLKTHLLTHKSPSEIKMFKCELCSYETKYKNSYSRHMWTHKSSSELKMFKCELCSHEVKHKYNLKAHLLTHKSPSEINMFKCAWCSYEQDRKCT